MISVDNYTNPTSVEVTVIGGLTWRVDGTLQNGEQVIIELTTRLNVTPTSSQVIKNVACIEI